MVAAAHSGRKFGVSTVKWAFVFKMNIQGHEGSKKEIQKLVFLRKFS